MNQHHRHESGFTLLEALIAIVIISIGLLGLVKLQTASLVNTQIAASMNQASVAAESMADRMRANMPGVEDSAYNSFTINSAKAQKSPSCTAKTCTKTEIAKHDLQQWRAVLEQSLPNPHASIEAIGNDPNKAPYRFKLQISWQRHDSGYQSNASTTTPDPCPDSNHCFTTRVTL